MKAEKKIAFKKTLRISFGIAVGILFLVTLIAASKNQGKVLLNPSPIIHLNDENEFSILQKEDIKNWLLSNRNINLSNMTIENLDINKMERIAEANPWVANAEVYLDNQNTLNIDITQRSPIARVFDKSGNSFYLDTANVEMPIRYGYTFPTVIFTNVPTVKSEEEQLLLKSKMVYLGKVIGADSFWNAQITQIEVQNDHTFIAVPLLGNQKIILGDTNDIQDKLNNLFAFYEKVSSKIGWNTYDTYDLRFKGQVVASPTLGKTPPKVDNKSLELPKQDATVKPEETVVAVAKKPEPKNKETEILKKTKKAIPVQVNTAKEIEKVQNKTNPSSETKKKENEPKYLYKTN